MGLDSKLGVVKVRHFALVDVPSDVDSLIGWKDAEALVSTVKCQGGDPRVSSQFSLFCSSVVVRD